MVVQHRHTLAKEMFAYLLTWILQKHVLVKLWLAGLLPWCCGG